MDCVLVEALLNQLLVSLLTSTANKITPSGIRVDSSQDRVLVDIHSERVVPGLSSSGRTVRSMAFTAYIFRCLVNSILGVI